MGLDIGTLTAHIGLDTKPLFLGASKANGILNSLGLGFGGLRSAALGAAAVIAGGLATRKMVQECMEIDRALTRASSRMHATAEQYQKMQEAVLGAKRPGKAAEIFSALGQKGFSAPQAMEAQPPTGKMMKAHTMDAVQAVDALSVATKNWNLQASASTHIFDVYTKATELGKTGVSEMTDSIAAAAPTASALGYTLEETAGMLASLAAEGMTGARAGSQLALSMRKAGKIASDYKMTNADVVTVIEELGKTTGGTQTLIDEFGARTATVALKLTQAGEQTRKFQEDMANTGGETAKLADSMSADLGTSVDLLKDSIGKVGKEAILPLMETLSYFFNSTRAWFEEHKDLVVGSMKLIGTAILMVMAVAVKAIELVILLGTAVWNFAATIVDAVMVIGKSFAAIATGEWDDVKRSFEDMKNDAIGFGRNMKDIGALAIFQNGQPTPQGAFVGPPQPVEHQKTPPPPKPTPAPPPAPGEAARIIDAQISAYEELQRSGRLTTAQLETLWTGYYDAMRSKIKLLEKDSVSLAKGEKTATALAHQRAKVQLDDLDAEHSSFIRNEALIQMQSSLYGDLVTSGKLSGQQLTAAWDQYESSVRAGIAKILEDAKKLPGIDMTALNAWVSEQEKSLQDKKGFAFGGGDMVGEQESSLRRILDTNISTRDQVQTVWDQLEIVSDKKISQEAAEIERTLGPEMANIFAEGAKNQLRQGKLEALGNDLQKWAATTGQRMTDALGEFFFDAATGKWDDWHNYVKSILDDLTRKVSDSAAQWLMDMSGLGSLDLSGLFGFTGIGNAGSGSSMSYEAPTFAAAGGVFSRPTFAMIGEAGPEAVIPLSRLRDETFLNRLAGRPSGSGGGAPTIVIQTPSPAAFKQTQAQMMSQIRLALSREMRRA